MNKNSLANLGKKGKNAGHQFSNKFKQDLYDLWVKKTDEQGGTKGRHLLEKAAEESPMAFIKMASSLLLRETLQENTVKLDFAETLMQLGKRIGHKPVMLEEDVDITDVEVLEVFDEPPLPVEPEIEVSIEPNAENNRPKEEL
ncbi:MAG: hypothetical protein H8D23_23925 [Candidatus Brocadiales bacterium]|nr:hypothetical protein [Candidatus Brocadiales bacterium]